MAIHPPKAEIRSNTDTKIENGKTVITQIYTYPMRQDQLNMLDHLFSLRFTFQNVCL